MSLNDEVAIAGKNPDNHLKNTNKQEKSHNGVFVCFILLSAVFRSEMVFTHVLCIFYAVLNAMYPIF